MANDRPNRPLYGLIDRPFTNHIKNFDRMTVELSPYMTEYEIDQSIEFMVKLQDTKFDVNPSPEDCKTQFQLMFGRDRFLEICQQWNQKNQKFLSVFGEMKFKHKVDGTIWDGLDDSDNPDDYIKIYV